MTTRLLATRLLAAVLAVLTLAACTGQPRGPATRFEAVPSGDVNPVTGQRGGTSAGSGR